MKLFTRVGLVGLVVAFQSGCGTEFSKDGDDPKSTQSASEDASEETEDQVVATSDLPDENEDLDSNPDTNISTDDPNIIEFHIKDGTGTAPWNTTTNPVVIAIGKTLRIMNDDLSGNAKAAKRLHTGGSPCPHSDKNIPVGGVTDCVIKKAYDFATGSPMYNHNVGTKARFYVKTSP